jgi:hypothetical protein
MKIIIASLVCLLVGSGFGYYFGYTRPTTKTDRYVWEQMHQMSDDNGAAAIVAMDAIPAIEAGDAQKAVQYLSFTIASYYTTHAIQPHSDALRLKLRTEIEQLASRNEIVAARIKASTNSLIKIP